jgi:hypothetical protein
VAAIRIGRQCRQRHLSVARPAHEDAKFIIPSDPASGKPPFICAKLPQFVETRGGDYFFLPSLTALRMIAMGTIDPT